MLMAAILHIHQMLERLRGSCLAHLTHHNIHLGPEKPKLLTLLARVVPRVTELPERRFTYIYIYIYP